MEVINEGSAVYVTVTRRDESGNLEAPTTLDWRLDCLTTQQNVSPWTAIDPPDAEQEIAVSPTLNTMQDSGNVYEDKEVVIRMDAGLSTQQIVTARYRLANVQGIE